MLLELSSLGDISSQNSKDQQMPRQLFSVAELNYVHVEIPKKSHPCARRNIFVAQKFTSLTRVGEFAISPLAV